MVTSERGRDVPGRDPDRVDRAGFDPTGFDPSGYIASLEDLGGLLLGQATLDDLLEHVLVLTARAVDTSVAVSVTVVDDDGQHTTAAASSDDARAVDDAQYAFDEGPCVEALHSGVEQRFDDLTELDRWPRFRAEALRLGFGSVLAVPLRAREHTVGCLNLFAAEPAGLGEEDREVARRIAAPVAAALANARAHGRVLRVAECLQSSLEAGAIVERAKGVLMAHAGCSSEEAAARLQVAAETTGRSLRDAAADLLARHDSAARTSAVAEDDEPGTGRAAGAGSSGGSPRAD